MNPVSLERNTPKPAAAMYQQPGVAAGGAPPMNPGMPQQMPGQYGQPPMGQQQPMPGQPPMGQYGQQPMGGQPPIQSQGQMPPQGQYGQQPMGGQPPIQSQGQYGQPPMGAPMQSQGQYGQPPMGQQMPGQPMPGQMPGQMGQQMPGQMGMPGQPMGGQPYGQVGMNPPLNRISLVKGQNMSLTKAAPGLKHARIGLGWDVRQSPGAAFDLDASCFLLNAQNQVCSPQHFVFYNNRQSPDGSVIQHGDNLTGMGEGDDEQVSVDLLRVPPDVQRVVFVCSIYEADQRQQNFGMVQRAFIRVVDQDTQQEIVRFDLTEEACMWNCMMFGELYRYGNEWKFKALGTGLQGGLRAVGAQFGMQLA